MRRGICGRTCGCDELCPTGETEAEAIRDGDYETQVSDAEMDGRAADMAYGRDY